MVKYVFIKQLSVSHFCLLEARTFSLKPFELEHPVYIRNPWYKSCSTETTPPLPSSFVGSGISGARPVAGAPCSRADSTDEMCLQILLKKGHIPVSDIIQLHHSKISSYGPDVILHAVCLRSLATSPFMFSREQLHVDCVSFACCVILCAKKSAVK